MRALCHLLMLAIFGGLITASPALSHTRSESHTSWLVDGSTVTMSFSASDVEARRITPDGRPPNDQLLIGYLVPRIGVSAAGRPCRAIRAPRPVATASGYRRVEFGFQCASVRQIVLHLDTFFDRVATHVDIAQIQTPSGDFIEQILTTDSRNLALDGEGGHRLEGAGIFQFMEMGIMHIFTGVDHMSFLIGLVLISRRLSDLAFVVSGFTLGHSLTLALAVTGVLRPHAEFIDALVALTIMLIGAENIAVVSRRPGTVAIWTGGALLAMTLLRLFGIGLLPPALLFGAALFSANYLIVSGYVREAARLRIVVTLIFGLIHGFGFAADLLQTSIPSGTLALLLVGFNLGVEVGQLTIVGLFAGGTVLLMRWKLAVTRRTAVDICAPALIAVGTFWFIGRSFG